jgi:hypothetical protein
MTRVWRLCLIATVAAAAFVVAIDRFNTAAANSCAQQVPVDRSYQVQWEQEPRTDQSAYRIKVTKGGSPVTGARVCVNAYMLGMSAMAVTDIGREVGPGTYELRLTFEMGDEWAGQVLVTESGKPMVSVPLHLNVMDVWGMSPSG